MASFWGIYVQFWRGVTNLLATEFWVLERGCKTGHTKQGSDIGIGATEILLDPKVHGCQGFSR